MTQEGNTSQIQQRNFSAFYFQQIIGYDTNAELRQKCYFHKALSLHDYFYSVDVSSDIEWELIVN